MSQDDLHQAAQADTPKEISIPNTPWALAAWVLARFGIGGGVIAAILYALNIVYGDMKAEAVKASAMTENVLRVQASTVEAINRISEKTGENTKSLDNLSDEIRRHTEREKP